MNVTFSAPSITVSVGAPVIAARTGTPVARDLVERDPYTGEYTVTPSAETQTLLTDGLRMTDNLTINPIPSDWGHIAWDGQTITVS